ncbi:propanediol dehydratase reactivation factor large subunit [Klebsiella pneumoniae]|uniref:Propanediol dehydratase reactivation factor large subunit n=1 Tax=Klebsiella pneumoniae TaxID=573 RepID=A0A447RQ64_KLEPN|nr:propanediol dehydratase reactivation factor large subunit [Klebsiella pneumoniae]
MRYIAGIDIGNSSTEVALATVDERRCAEHSPQRVG